MLRLAVSQWCTAVASHARKHWLKLQARWFRILRGHLVGKRALVRLRSRVQRGLPNLWSWRWCSGQSWLNFCGQRAAAERAAANNQLRALVTFEMPAARQTVRHYAVSEARHVLGRGAMRS